MNNGKQWGITDLEADYGCQVCKTWWGITDLETPNGKKMGCIVNSVLYYLYNSCKKVKKIQLNAINQIFQALS